MNGLENREYLYSANMDWLSEKAGNSLKKGYDAASIVMIIIDVDDPNWTDLANDLVPNQNWQAIRDQGGRPLARGSVFATEIRAFVSEMIPDLKEALYQAIPDGYFQAIVLGFGGGSVFYIEPK